jgi:hypothetical protein
MGIKMSKAALLDALGSCQSLDCYLEIRDSKEIISDIREAIDGCTLRDQFALAILPALMTRHNEPCYNEVAAIFEAYNLADSALEARKEKHS